MWHCRVISTRKGPHWSLVLELGIWSAITGMGLVCSDGVGEPNVEPLLIWLCFLRVSSHFGPCRFEGNCTAFQYFWRSLSTSIRAERLSTTPQAAPIAKNRQLP